MRRWLLLIVVSLLPVAGYAGDEPGPDMRAVLALVGRFMLAHACPVSATEALTCGHVVDPRPFDQGVGLSPYWWSNERGDGGNVTPQSVVAQADLALLSGSFPNWYERATAAPAVGDRVWFVGYELNGRRFLEPRIIEARVQRVVANHVVYSPGGQPGSSGSCVLNERAEVVAIHCATSESGAAGFGPGVFGVGSK